MRISLEALGSSRSSYIDNTQYPQSVPASHRLDDLMASGLRLPDVSTLSEQKMIVKLEPLNYKEETLFPYWERQINGQSSLGDYRLTELMDEHTLKRLNRERKALKEGEKSPKDGLLFSSQMEGLDLSRFDLFRQGILKNIPRVSGDSSKFRES